MLTARLTFASSLRRIRRARDLSQEKLAELAGFHRTYVSMVERGQRNVPVDSMERLVNALGKSRLVIEIFEE